VIDLSSRARMLSLRATIRRVLWPLSPEMSYF
jgi:hypothetical protein